MAYRPVILVTGFEPFLGSDRNPSVEAVMQLPDELLGCRIERRELPVVWFDYINMLDRYMDELRPRAVLGVGQGYPAPPILIERIGMNICNGPDNSHEVDLRDEPLFFGGPAAYFTTTPYAAMHKRLKEEGIPVRYNFNAGQNQCNGLLYSALHLAATKYQGVRAGFIHVPMLPEQSTPERPVEGYPLEKTARAIRLCVEEICRAVTYSVRTLDQYREEM